MAEIAPWVSAADLAADPKGAALTLPQGVTWADVAQAASNWLFLRTGQRFTTTQDTVRPHRLHQECGCSPGSAGGLGVLGDYAWCVCAAPFYQLPGPVISVDSVVVDGAVVPTSSYYLTDDGQLVRTDGSTWRCCQPMAVPLGQPGTWSVTYTHGRPVPTDGKMAARALAIEIAKSITGQACALPARATSVTRQGVSAQTPRVNYLERREGFTGVALVDLFLQAYPQRRRSRVVSPDAVRSTSV